MAVVIDKPDTQVGEAGGTGLHTTTVALLVVFAGETECD
jgi:hypothetical protein